MRKRTKKFLFVILIVVLLIALFDFVFNCDFGKASYNYKQNDDGTIILTEYLGDKKYILIPSVFDEKHVVSLERTFFENSNVEKVYIQPGVKVIDSASFYGCENLKTVYIPKTVTRLGENAFAYSGIQRINISQVTEIDIFCFYECKELYFFVSETKEILQLRGSSFFNSGLTYMFLEKNPQYTFTTFSQTCTFGTNQSQLSKVVCLIPGFIQLLTFLQNYQISQWLIVLLLITYLLALVCIELYKVYVTLCGALNKNSYKKYLLQEREIINKTDAMDGMNKLARFKKINRTSTGFKFNLLVFVSLPYVYLVFLIWSKLLVILDITTFFAKLILLFLILLSPLIVVIIFKFIRSIYRTIKLRRFDLPVKPKLRILKLDKKRRYKYDK